MPCIVVLVQCDCVGRSLHVTQGSVSPGLYSEIRLRFSPGRDYIFYDMYVTLEHVELPQKQKDSGRRKRAVVISAELPKWRRTPGILEC